VPKRKLAAYRRIAARAGKVWKKHGALEYRECVGDDLKIGAIGVPFPKAARTRPGETVLFSWIVYKSKAHRKAVHKRVMRDPWIVESMQGPMPFDVKRMSMGGFKVIVDL
jgi:uncharacterized protein YbaA (DUF1428 family)